MSRLEKLFRYINEYNTYAVAYYVNEDNNYKINKGYTTEICKNRLNELSDIKLIFEAKNILINY